MAEATNDLAFLVTGAYGKPVAKSQGAPLRLAVPWKYGFKSVKSIIPFQLHRPAAQDLWEALQASEYGFWANVNPEVPHPRWSQASETLHRASASGGRPCCSTATANSSPASTRAWRASGCGPEAKAGARGSRGRRFSGSNPLGRATVRQSTPQ